MKDLTKIIFGFILSVMVISAQTWAFPQFTREEEPGGEGGEEDTTEDEEDEEDTDDVYDEEQSGSTTKATPEPEEEDKDDLEDRLAREKIANRLGINNFTSAAIVDKASELVVTLLKARYPEAAPPRPRKKIKPDPISITTPQIEIIETTISSSPEVMPKAEVESTTEMNKTEITNATSQIRKFVITVPHNMNGTGGGTIEINIPMPMMIPANIPPPAAVPPPMEDTSPHHTQMAIMSPDEQGVKNIEAAIMEALLIAQQMATMTMSTSSSNNTEILELDIGDLKQVPEKEEDSATENVLVDVTTEAGNSTGSSSVAPQKGVAPKFQPEIVAPPLPPPRQERTTSKPRRKRPPGPTRAPTTPRTPAPGDTYGVGPVTDLIVSQIRSGQLPSFLWGSLMKLAKSEYAQIAVDAVECAVFYYCPDDTELGTLSKGGIF